MAEGNFNLPQGSNRNRPMDRLGHAWREFRAGGGTASVVIAAVFFLAITALFLLRADLPRVRLGDYLSHPIHSRVDFSYFDTARFETAQQFAREAEPRVYRPNPSFSWDSLEQELKHLPDTVAGKTTGDLPESLAGAIDGPTILALAQYQSADRRAAWGQAVEAFLLPVRKSVVLANDSREEETQRQSRLRLASSIDIKLMGADGLAVSQRLDQTVPVADSTQLLADLTKSAKGAFDGHSDLPQRMVEYVRRTLRPTYVFDEAATRDAQDRAAAVVPDRAGNVVVRSGQIIKQRGEVTLRDLQIFRDENKAYLASLGEAARWQADLGIAGMLLVVVVVCSAYVTRYQPRIVRNHARGAALAGLMFGMLLIAQLAAVPTRPVFVFGIAPTILVAMITAIAYERRFALGLALFHAVLATMLLRQGLDFFCVLLTGVAISTSMLNEVRTRGKLIEVGLTTAMAMGLVTIAMQTGILGSPQPLSSVLSDAMHAGLSGLAVGFIVLGILPFIEKAFRITTGMTLLELADASHPLQRRLATEAPGTYNHSLQVANLAEAAAEAIGANALMARVGALYHDIGKVRKAEFFCENQADGVNRHMSLSPDVSFLIILNHIKDGLDLAREHSLPTALFPFIQGHHGTTLVEYFYYQARQSQQDKAAQAIKESAFRYPGPKPRSREVAIVMLCDTCESACRSITDLSAGKIEAVTHELVLKRLLDGQLSECDLSMRELAVVEHTIARTLLSIHHGRVAYPSIAPPQSAIVKTA